MEALQQLVRREPQRHPLVIALVAPLGTPLDPVVSAFELSLRRFNYASRTVHLSHLLDSIEYRPWGDLPERTDRTYYQRRMDAGDQLRKDVRNGAALAALAVAEISATRMATGEDCAVILRSLKHPTEVQLLQHIYGDAFSLVAVVSSVDERREALEEILGPFDDPRADAEQLMSRDEFDSTRSEFGQRVRDVFSMADVYIPVGRGLRSGPDIDRFVDSLFGAPFLTPSPIEEGMRLAFDASLRSAAIGRQVGAALIPTIGTPVIVGTNEVPKPGGGQYWSGDVPDYRDFQTGTDPNPVYTRLVVRELLDRLAERGWLVEDLRQLSGAQLLERALARDAEGDSMLQGARAAALIEFTRCLHAEQAAIVNAARGGIVTEGASLYTTTFPCHECAKMIVGSGIVDVFYVEPYPKSLVSRLYRDLIEVAPSSPIESGLVGGKVPFRPFVGVAPRHYERAFSASERIRGQHGEVLEFDRRSACPQTGGWNESGVRERESATVDSISRLVELLGALKAQEGGAESSVGDAGEVAQPVAATEIRERPGS